MVNSNSAVADTARANGRIDVWATDVTRQRRHHLRGVRPDATVRDLVAELVDRLGLSRHSPSGAEYAFYARSDREGRYLLEREILGDVLQPGDTLTIQPSIVAG